MEIARLRRRTIEVVVIVAAAILLAVGVQYSLGGADALAAAEQYIATSSAVHELLGEHVVVEKLPATWARRVDWSPGIRFATYDLRVEGRVGSGRAHVTLAKRADGDWRVFAASITTPAGRSVLVE